MSVCFLSVSGMKKLLLLIAVSCATLALNAQNQTPAEPQQTAQPAVIAAVAPTLRFGYFSYNHVLAEMPGYASAQKNLAELRAQYEAETKRNEQDFNAKYEDYLSGAATFDPVIREKRQAELQSMMDKNIAFKKKAAQLLADAEARAINPIKEKLAAAVQNVGQNGKFAFILNTDNNTTPFVNHEMGVDVTTLILNAAK